MTATAEQIIDVGDEVLAIVLWRGRGKRSGLDVEERQGYVWTIRSGKAQRVVGYAEPAEALEAVGSRG